MKTIATLGALAVIALLAFGISMLAAGSHTATKAQDAYTTVQDMNDAQDAILRGAK